MTLRLSMPLPLVPHDLVRHDPGPDVQEHHVPVSPFIAKRNAGNTSSAVFGKEEKIAVFSAETRLVFANVHFVRPAILVLKMPSQTLAHWSLSLAAHQRVTWDRPMLGVPAASEGNYISCNAAVCFRDFFRHPRSFGDRLVGKFASFRANGPPNSPVANIIRNTKGTGQDRLETHPSERTFGGRPLCFPTSGC